MADDAAETIRAGMSESEMRDNVVRLAFGGDGRSYERFCEILREAIPPGNMFAREYPRSMPYFGPGTPP